MQQLMLSFDKGQISGTGTDIVGPFTFNGLIENGRVSLLKRYTGQHTVSYLGNYDGEGTMHGTWQAGTFRGPWAIRLEHHDGRSRGDDITEWNPSAS